MRTKKQTYIILLFLFYLLVPCMGLACYSVYISISLLMQISIGLDALLYKRIVFSFSYSQKYLIFLRNCGIVSGYIYIYMFQR